MQEFNWKESKNILYVAGTHLSLFKMSRYIFLSQNSCCFCCKFVSPGICGNLLKVCSQLTPLNFRFEGGSENERVLVICIKSYANPSDSMTPDILPFRFERSLGRRSVTAFLTIMTRSSAWWFAFLLRFAPQVIKAIEDGFRLPAPVNCPPHLHQLMLDCWQKERTERPTFSQIHSALSKSIRSPDGIGSSTLARRCGPPTPTDWLTDSLVNVDVMNPSVSPPPARTLSSSITLAERPLPSFPAFNSVGEWLDAVDMGRYKDNFTAAGYCYLESVARMTVQWVAQVDSAWRHCITTATRDVNNWLSINCWLGIWIIEFN